MLTDEQMAILHRRLTLVGAVAKHGFYAETRVVDAIDQDEMPLISAAIDGNDSDIANLFAELRIYRQMFDAKLEGFRNGSARTVEPAQEQEPSGVGSGDRGGASVDLEAARESKPTRKRRKRPDPEADSSGAPPSPKPVDAGDD